MFSVVIPARYGSTRFPGKPLVDLCGKPMIAHVVERAKASGAEKVIVATDEMRVAEAASAAGAEGWLTGDYRTGSDRVAGVVRDWEHSRVVVNVQGDEPLVDPETIKRVAKAVGEYGMVTAAESDEINQPLTGVGVVMNAHQEAMYFSRTRLPSSARHIGIYGFRVGTLLRFAAARTGICEQAEQLEQIRALEIGIRIRVVWGESGQCVDTPEDAEKVREIMRGNQQCATG